MTPASQSTAAVSRATKGSSRIHNGRFSLTRRASATRRFCPCDRYLQARSSRPARPTCSSASIKSDDFRGDLCYLGHLNAIKEELTPLENLLAAARLADEELSEDDAIDALEQVGLAGREDLACKYLSQGQKRRVALAHLVNEKRPLWILDEPFVALDTAAVDWLAGVISGHLQRGGLAVMTTHQLVNIPAGTVRELRLP